MAAAERQPGALRDLGHFRRAGDYVIARRRARVDVARGCGNDVAPVLIERKYAAVHKSIFAAVLPRPTHNLHARTDALV